LFVDMVGSTEKAAALGDSRWRGLLVQFHELVGHELERFRGRLVNTAGDGVFASFDGPARAIRCACAIRDQAAALGTPVRLGLHTGECEVIDNQLAGIAVHIGARVAAAAEPGQVVVSSTVKDLVAGSGLRFSEGEVHTLKGVPGEWRLFAVV
jgi:class 3 adenylate cyclase